MSKVLFTESSKPIQINVGRVETITIHQITDSELDDLEEGSATGWLFDVFIALITTGIAFAVTITTTTISDRLFAVYTALAIGSIIGGVICFFSWRARRKSISSIVKRIRERAVEVSVSEKPAIPQPQITEGQFTSTPAKHRGSSIRKLER